MSGGSISHEEGARILAALGLTQVPDAPECWLIPPHRLDLTRPCDLLEEIVRVFGLDGIPVPLLRPLRRGIPGRRGPQFPDGPAPQAGGPGVL